jgi:tetratricopeptide (TPR) repeat protein
MPSEREYEQLLESDPANDDAFLALRKAYREEQRFDKLVTLYETRAQAVSDQAKAADLFYLAAEVRLANLEDTAGAEADLAHAVSRDAGHHKAARRLKDIYREAGRIDEYRTTLEMEAGAAAHDPDPAHIAELRDECEKAWAADVARLEQALGNPTLRAGVTPELLKTVEQARKIAAALADYALASRIFDLEISASTDPKRRVQLMFRQGRMLAERVGDLPAAAQKLSDVVRMYPRDDKALDALAAVYANPNWTGSDGGERAASLYCQIARRRQEAGDVDSSVAALRKAFAAVPGHAEASSLMERVLTDAGRMPDLDRFLRERVVAAQSDQEKIDLLFKRAQLAKGARGDSDEVLHIYNEIVALEPADGQAARHLAKLYQERQDYGKLAELRERQLAKAAQPEFRVELLRELAALYRDRLGDRDQAAVYLHAILEVNPADVAALEGYAEHFRQNGSWRELADLFEFSIEHALANGAELTTVMRRLEEVAVIAETKLSDMDRALALWRRMSELDPSYERARAAYKRLLQKAKRWDDMAVLLADEARHATEPTQKADALRRLARLHIDKLEAPERAAAVYVELLAIDPKDVVAMRFVVDAYEHGAKWAELATLLRSQIGHSANDAEKVTLLRRLLGLYQEQLADAPNASWAAAQILKLVPGDPDALERLERLLEHQDDKPRLLKMLEYHVRYAATSDEKLVLYRRIAELAQDHLGDLPKAIAYWEKLLASLPTDQRALQALIAAYEQGGRHEDLARVLDLQQHALSGDPVAAAEIRRRLARLTGNELKQTERAEENWQELLKLVPDDREALEALSAIAEVRSEWTSLADLLDRRIGIATNPSEAVPLAMQRGQLFTEKLGDPAEAMRAFERIINELEPSNVEAHQMLRQVAESQQDWARVVDVAGKQLRLTADPKERVERALDIGVLCRDRLGDEARAISAFEQVLEIEAEQTDALRALVRLYESAHDGERLIATKEKLLRHTSDPEERRRLLFAMANAAEQMLEQPRRAFDLLRRAYHEQPDDAALERLEAAAEAHNLWEDLIKVYAGEGVRTPAEQVAVALKVANLCETRLHQPARAFTVLREALPFDPAGAALEHELERLARDTQDWRSLLDVYAQIALGRPEAADRVALLRRRAEVREHEMQDEAGAFDEFLRAFSVQPGDEGVHQEILRLAEATGRWEDALKVEGQIFARAESREARVEIATRAAELVEEKVQDRVRAFRGYLNAFRLDPENEAVIANLWRLGESIGSYVEHGAPVAQAAATVTSELEIGDSSVHSVAEGEALPEVEYDEVTGEIEITDVEVIDTPPPPPPPPPSLASPWQEWAQAYETLAADSAARHTYLCRTAEIWERGAHDLDRALQTLARAYAMQPDDESVSLHMERLAQEGGRWDQICEIYLRVSERVPRERAVSLQLRVGQIREQLGQPDLAEARYRAVQAAEPDNRVALNRLEHICRTAERWADLAHVLERRTQGAAARLEGSELRHKAFELAELYEKRLERPYEAIDTLERYVASVDDEERAAEDSPHRAAELMIEARAGHAALARLYGRVGMSHKAAASLQRELQLAGHADDAREARRHLGEIFERELGVPAKAVEMYESILADWPDDSGALAALDRLHQSAGQFEALDRVLQRRIELAEGAVRIELTRRRAHILEEKLGNPDAAAACLRTLGSAALADASTAAALMRNLRSAGLAHEALRLLEQRVEALSQESASAHGIASVYLQIAQLKADDLADGQGAMQALEEALRLVPGDPAALGMLAHFHLKRNDFQAYAESLLRQADALEGKPEQAAVLLEAGAVTRDQLNDEKQARACFERAVTAHPSNPDALQALAAMLAAVGKLDEAGELYERQLGLVDAAAKPAVLTHLARVLCEKPDGLGEAQSRLDQALELDPNYLPAVLNMADILYREQQWAQAERRLNQALFRLRGQPEQTAKLYHRLGEVYEKLGRLDEGYKQLLEADRAIPGQLMLRIALGENRFQARRWREAAQHLEGVAQHPAAADYPEEVVQALAHGAMAELRQKRPEQAAALHQAALGFTPQHPQTLRALADLALERGDKMEAARSLQRVAESSGDRDERLRLFEQIGDLHLALGNSSAARTAYEDAVGLLATDDATHLGLLEKAAAAQRADGAWREAMMTSRRIADTLTDPLARCQRRRELATLEVQHGDFAAAVDLLEKALQDNAGDEEALHELCAAYDGANRSDEVATTLGRLLPGLPEAAANPEARRRRADLWERMGRISAGRDRAAAISALTRAIDVDSNRVAARAALADLYGEEVSDRLAALENHRALVLLDPTHGPSLRTLAREYANQQQTDRARCCYEVLDLLGLSSDDERAFMTQHPLPDRKPDDPYAGTLEDGGRTHLAPSEMPFVGEVMASVWEGIPGLSPATLDSFGVGPQDKVSPMSDLDVARIYGQAIKALGNRRTNLYIKPDTTFESVCLVGVAPPAIIVGPRPPTSDEHGELRFRIGRAVELTRPEFVLAATLTGTEFDMLFSGVLKAFHPKHARFRAGTDDAAAEQAARLRKALPYKLAKRMGELFQQHVDVPLDPARWRSTAEQAGNRAGLLLCGVISVAARLVLRESAGVTDPNSEVVREYAASPGPLRDLLRYAVSDAYFVARDTLGLAKPV